VELEATVSELNGRISELDAATQAMRSENAADRSELQFAREAVARVQQLEVALTDARIESESHHARVQEVSLELRESLDRNVDLQSHLDRCSVQLAETNSQLDEAQKAREEAVTSAQQMAKELINVQRKVGSLDRVAQDAMRQFEEQRQVISQQEQAMSESKTWQSQAEELRAKLDASDLELLKRSSEQNNLQRQLDQLQSMLLMLRDRLHHATSSTEASPKTNSGEEMVEHLTRITQFLESEGLGLEGTHATLPVAELTVENRIQELQMLLDDATRRCCCLGFEVHDMQFLFLRRCRNEM
jgi:chromosome segregation ATPase